MGAQRRRRAVAAQQARAALRRRRARAGAAVVVGAPSRRRTRLKMLAGTLFALAAGLMWGLVFIGPLLLPEYPAALLSFGRYVAFGVIALPLAWADRGRLAEFERRSEERRVGKECRSRWSP